MGLLGTFPSKFGIMEMWHQVNAVDSCVPLKFSFHETFWWTVINISSKLSIPTIRVNPGLYADTGGGGGVQWELGLYADPGGAMGTRVVCGSLSLDLIRTKPEENRLHVWYKHNSETNQWSDHSGDSQGNCCRGGAVLFSQWAYVSKYVIQRVRVR